MKMFGDVPEGVTVWKDETWQAPDRGFLSDQDRKFMEFCAHRTPAPSLNGITREEIKANPGWWKSWEAPTELGRAVRPRGKALKRGKPYE